MRKIKFKIGDRVECISPFVSRKDLVGKKGVIVHELNENWGVEFDNWNEGHSCDGHCQKHDAGRYGPSSALKLIKEKTVKSKFKVGDKVRCIGDSTGHGDTDPKYGGSGWKKNTEFIIRRVDFVDYLPREKSFCYFGEGNGVYEEFLEDVNKKEIKTMKKGIRSGVVKRGDAYIQADAYNVLELCVKMNEPALLIGETGVGKTTVVRELAKVKKKKLIRISLNGSTGVEEILGKWLANKGSTYWQDGILVAAMKAGDWVVMDEINAALPEILFTLHSLLDDDRSIVLAEKDNEKIKPHKDFRFFSTMNPPEDYAGTKDLNKALISRFTAILNIHPLSDVDETTLLTDMYGVKPDIAFRLVDMANKLRKAKAKDTIFYFCSTRDLVQAGKLIANGLDIGLAVVASVMNKMSKDELQEVIGIFNGFEEVKAPTMTYSEIIEYAEALEKDHSKLKEDYVILEKVVEKVKEDVVKKVEIAITKTVKEIKLETIKKEAVKK